MSSCSTRGERRVSTIGHVRMNIVKHVRSIILEFPGVLHIFAQCKCMIQLPRPLSDQKAFLLFVKGRPRSRIMTRRKQPGPSSRYLTDRAYCEDIKTSCNIVSSGTCAVDGCDAWHMWCDGGTRTAPLIGHRDRRVTVGAGWGFCLFPARLPDTYRTSQARVDAHAAQKLVLQLRRGSSWTMQATSATQGATPRGP